MFKRVAFTMYPVSDMARAVAFYSDVLGLPGCKELVPGKWVEYDMPQSGCFALTTMMADMIPDGQRGGCLAFEVEDLQGLCATLKDKGVTFHNDIFESPVCHGAMIQDTEGNLVMLHQLKRAS